jgi:predicted transcriptional regulator
MEKKSAIKRCSENNKDSEMKLQKLQTALGKDLVRRREEMGYSQKQFICASGIPQSTVSAVEQGKSNVTLETLRRYAESYYAPIVDMLRCLEFHCKQ